MTRVLKKWWFIVLLTTGVTFALVRPGLAGTFTQSMSPLNLIAPALYLMALSLESRSLYEAVIRPLPALWAVTISYGLVPVLSGIAKFLLPETGLQIGLMIVASVPCTLASAVLWTRMAGGSEATALLVTVLTTCSSWLATTAWLVYGTGTHVHVNATGMMSGLFLILILPVCLGQLTRFFVPVRRAATRFKSLLGIVAQLLILAIILKATVDIRQKLNAETVIASAFIITGVVVLGTHITALALGFWSSRFFGFDRQSQIAVAFSGSQKTLPVSLYLLDAHFKSYPLALVPIVFYHVGQLIVDTFIAERMINSSNGSSAIPAEARS